MRFSMDNFLYAIKQIVMGRNGDDISNSGTAQSTDGGIKVDKSTPVLSAAGSTALTDNTGGTATSTLAAVTVPDLSAWNGTVDPTAAQATAIDGAITALKNAVASIASAVNARSSNASLVAAAGTNVSLATVQFAVPRDYDEASDHFFVRVFIALANADAAITLTGTPTFRPLGQATTTGAAVTGKLPFTTTAANLSTTEQVIEIDLSGNSLVRDEIVTVALALVGTTTGTATIFAVQNHYDSSIVSYNETDLTGNATGTLPGFGNPLR